MDISNDNSSNTIETNFLERPKYSAGKKIKRIRKSREERNAITKRDESSRMKFSIEHNKYKGDFQQQLDERKRVLNKSICNSYTPESNNKEDLNKISLDLNEEIKISLDKQAHKVDKIPKRAVSQAKKMSNGSDEALIFIEVNLKNTKKRIIVHDGVNIEKLVEGFGKENSNVILYYRTK